uniref:Major facilitator superfamily (MFS) profile domain-containing protein n=2 Tax=Plectus sambesii TaxID=2011161 RepID=A0A914VEB0_9BILA
MAEVTERRTLVVLFSVLVLDLLAFTCILPLFPALIDFYAVEPHRDSLYSNCENALKSFRAFIGAPDVSRLNSVFFGGLLGSLFSALQFVSSPLMGALSDIFGRKSVLIVSVVGSLMAYVLWSSAATFTIFVVSRIVGGLSKASVSVAIAVIADVCPTERRGKGMVSSSVTKS